MLSATSGTAQTIDPEPWIEMATACEALIVGQTTDPFADYEAAEPRADVVKGDRHVSVRHPTANILASAVSHGSSWNDCTVYGAPAVMMSGAGDLASILSARQSNRSKSETHRIAFADDERAIGPVLERCGTEGERVLVTAYRTPGGEVRVTSISLLSSSWDDDLCAR